MTQKQMLAALAVVVVVVVGVVLYTRSNNANNTNVASTSATTNESAKTSNSNVANTNVETGNETPAPETAAPDGNDVAVTEITYDGKTFSPSAVTIKSGDVVIFKNNSTADFWPASGPHPTHTLYPEFDAKKGIAPGQSYQFKFIKVGIWPFHDHLNPSAFGKITVQ
jgi:plastocyanin